MCIKYDNYTSIMEAPMMDAPPPAPAATEALPPPPPQAGPREPHFPRCPGETPRAFSAFTTYFQLGRDRSLQGVADRLGEKIDTVKSWSSKYGWRDRIQSFHSGLLEQQAQAQAAACREQAAEWGRRAAECRELQFAAAHKLFTGALCYLENLGETEVGRMSLSQASHAVQVASRISSQAVAGGMAPETPARLTLPAELMVALQKAYGQPSTLPANSATPRPAEPAPPDSPPTQPTNPL